jgi:type VI secretion system protein ImpE
MSAKEHLDAGRLTAALKQVTEELRTNPGDTRLRVFLFELLCFAGELERARKQLEIVAQNGAESEIAVHRYMQVLTAEAKRRQCFSSGLRPKVIGEASYAQTYFEALDCFREGKVLSAAEILEDVQDELPAVQGSINGDAFQSFADANDLTGPFAEAFLEDQYCWIPWALVKSVSLSKPRYLRDLAWLPVSLELENGLAGDVFFPVLYVDSYEQATDIVKLGRETRWREDIDGLAIPIGQKTFVADERDYALLEIESLELRHADSYTAA